VRVEPLGVVNDQKVGDVKENKTNSSGEPLEILGEEESEGKKATKRKGRGLKGRVAELEENLEKVSSEASENYDGWLRARAEYENLKKRTVRDIQLTHQRAGEGLVSRLLPVLDDLEKAIEAAGGAMKEGLDLISKGLLDALRDSGVAAIDPAGEPFDPNVHEAIMQRPAEGSEPGTVLEVLQKGYLMNGLVLRAAKVIVAAEKKE
jgi:molecular chaperone GrpE